MPQIDEKRAARSVLVAEDNGINLMYIETVLTDAGYIVLSAGNGVEVLSLLESETPGLILMDVQMPEMDGIECTRRIRANPDPELSSLPIVALTGYVMEADKKRCFDASMNAFLSKPFEDEDLLRIVEENRRGEARPESSGSADSPSFP